MYNYVMTKFERWMLRRIARRIVIQSHEHMNNITEYYRIMADAAGDEFREDNRPTLEDFLQECHTDGFNRSWPLIASRT